MKKIVGAVVTLLGFYILFTGEMAGGFVIAAIGILFLVAGFRGPVRKCPFCAIQIPKAAIICPHCQRDLSP